MVFSVVANCLPLGGKRVLSDHKRKKRVFIGLERGEEEKLNAIRLIRGAALSLTPYCQLKLGPTTWTGHQCQSI